MVYFLTHFLVVHCLTHIHVYIYIHIYICIHFSQRGHSGASPSGPSRPGRSSGRSWGRLWRGAAAAPRSSSATRAAPRETARRGTGETTTISGVCASVGKEIDGSWLTMLLQVSKALSRLAPVNFRFNPTTKMGSKMGAPTPKSYHWFCFDPQPNGAVFFEGIQNPSPPKQKWLCCPSGVP